HTPVVRISKDVGTAWPMRGGTQSASARETRVALSPHRPRLYGDKSGPSGNSAKNSGPGEKFPRHGVRTDGQAAPDRWAGGPDFDRRRPALLLQPGRPGQQGSGDGVHRHTDRVLLTVGGRRLVFLAGGRLRAGRRGRPWGGGRFRAEAAPGVATIR